MTSSSSPPPPAAAAEMTATATATATMTTTAVSSKSSSPTSTTTTAAAGPVPAAAASPPPASSASTTTPADGAAAPPPPAVASSTTSPPPPPPPASSSDPSTSQPAQPAQDAAAAAALPPPAPKQRRRWKFVPVDYGRKDGVGFNAWLPEDEPAKYSPPPASSSASASSSQETFNADVESIGWTKFETDTLLDLYARFHGCIPVVVDRWPSSLVARTELELKERLYAMLPSTGLALSPLDFAPERARLRQLDALFAARATPESLARQRALVQDIRALQQELVTLRTLALPKPLPVPTSRLEQRSLEVRDEDFSSTNCWMRSNLLDPRFLQGVCGGSGGNGGGGGGKDTMLVVYEVLNVLQVPMDPVPTAAVCEAHGRLKADTLKLLAFRRQIDKLSKQAAAAATAAASSTVKIEPMFISSNGEADVEPMEVSSTPPLLLLPGVQPVAVAAVTTSAADALSSTTTTNSVCEPGVPVESLKRTLSQAENGRVEDDSNKKPRLA